MPPAIDATIPARHDGNAMHVPVSLRRLFPRASFVGCADVGVTQVTESSSQCAPDVVFAALPGTRTDGTCFVNEAIERGAKALLLERPLPGVAVPQCIVPNARKAYAELCAALAGYPSRKLTIAGVTGTNGKTTVTWLVHSILRTAGRQTGLLGTVEYNDGRQSRRGGLTTPDSQTLAHWLRQMVRRETSHAAIEISSHALDQDRSAGTLLDAAVVTNVTQDHFDYHRDFPTYLASKRRILEQLKPGGVAILNVDDPACAAMREFVPGNCRVVGYGMNAKADVRADILEESLSGSVFRLHHSASGTTLDVHTPLIGRHNVSNCLAAAAIALAFGVEPFEIAAGIESFDCVPGRLERVDCGQPFDVFVDYAHTDDALRHCVRCLKSITAGRVICVFGAGGDRDRSKRPLLAKAASEADLAVVTSDNPRTENPEQIIDDILAGFDGADHQPHVEADRAEAIGWALEQAQDGDCVLVAGKGHETVQIVGTRRIPFDDCEVVRRNLQEPIPVPFAEPLRQPA